MASRHPITCHVLNTITGKPAANISCILSKRVDQKFVAFAEATTNSDGRISLWSVSTGPDGSASAASLDEFNAAAQVAGQDSEDSLYQVAFQNIEDYFGGDTFFPYIEIAFKVPAGAYGKEHFHIPLLLSKYSYSTYRGS